MIEHDAPNGGPALSLWYDESIEKFRVSATPGGIALDADEMREFRDELEQMLEQTEDDDQ